LVGSLVVCFNFDQKASKLFADIVQYVGGLNVINLVENSFFLIQEDTIARKKEKENQKKENIIVMRN